MSDNVTITANIVEGSSSNPDVNSGDIVQSSVVQGSPITADLTEGTPVSSNLVDGPTVAGDVVTGGKGDKGDTGDQGPIGLQGPTGPQGPQGDPGVVQSIVAGNNIDVDATDPENPVVSVENLVVADITDLTASATELNYTDGVTSAIQTQLNNKQPLDADLTALAAAGNSTVLAATTASFLTADETKLDGIEAGADVTDATNVAAAGAFMKATDDTDDITVGATNKFATAAEKAKLANITVTQAVDLDTMESDIAGKQPLDSDLTTIAGLTPTTDNFMVATASAWASRTPSQARTQLGLGTLATLSTVTETEITLADVTTNDFSTTKHGFVPKGTNTGKFLKDDGTWGSIPGGGDMLAATYDPATIAEQLVGLTATQTLTNKTLTSPKINENVAVTATATELNYTDGVTSAIQTQLDAKQPLDSDLTTIAGLTATTDNFIQSVGSAWASRTPAQAALAIGNILYPVGMILELTVSTNPGTLLGFGTWTAFGTGRVTVAIDSGQTEFDTNGETGGAKTHTLTTAEMPSHTHIQDAHTHVQNPHLHLMTSVAIGATRNYTVFGTDAGIVGNRNTDNTTATNQNTTATNQNTGGGGAHNNLQPYIVVYRWQRTA